MSTKSSRSMRSSREAPAHVPARFRLCSCHRSYCHRELGHRLPRGWWKSPVGQALGSESDCCGPETLHARRHGGRARRHGRGPAADRASARGRAGFLLGGLPDRAQPVPDRDQGLAELRRAAHGLSAEVHCHEGQIGAPPLHPVTITTHIRRGPCAPITSRPPMSPVRDGPEIMLMVRGSTRSPNRARSLSHASS